MKTRMNHQQSNLRRAHYSPMSLLLAVGSFLLSSLFVSAQTVPPTPPSVPAPPPSTFFSSTSRVLPGGVAKAPVTDRPDSREETYKLPLRKLIGPKDPIVMRNSSSIYTVFVPQSPRFQLKSSFFHLEFTNSIALLTERSLIRVVVNDVIVGQYYLDRNKPFNSVNIAIPTSLMKVGFNRLQFIVAQHYTYKCEDPSAPELFTEINPDASYVSATGEWKEVPQRLSYLRWWVDERQWTPYKFNVCMPGGGQMSDLNLALGAIVTQGVALALNNQPFRVMTATALRPGMDNIVIGTMNELSGFLNSAEMGAIGGSFLAIKALPGDATHTMIIISGRNDQEVSQAAHAFGLINFPLPDSQYAIVDQMNLPTKATYIRNAPMDVPGIYSFRQLGYKTKSIKGWHTGGYTLRLYMPGDISKDDSSNAELRLHFSYGAGMRKDSVFNLFVNGQFQTVVRLNREDGDMHTDHRVYLPMQSFQPGLNTVDLVPEMIPLFSKECEILQDENLHFTLYDDSDFVFPRALRKARLPSLGLFSQTGFPYAAVPDGSETAVFIAGRDLETVCAGWTLLGKMAQISGALLTNTEISSRAPRSKKSLIVVGPRDQIPEELVAKAPVSPLQVGRMRYLISQSPKPEKFAASPVEEFMEKIRGVPSDRMDIPAPSTAKMNMTADLIEDTVAVQFESPFNPGYPVTLVTAYDGPRLLEGMNMLQDRTMWDNLSGDLAVWNTNPDSLAVCKVGEDFFYKNTSVVTRVGSKFEQQPILFALLLVGILVIIGLAVSVGLKRRKTRRGINKMDEE